MSLVNTPPRVRNSRSLSSSSSAISRLWQTFGIFASSSGGRSYRSLSDGSPGWILFWMPSRPAIISAAKHRYGLAVGSGKRVSMRRAFSLAAIEIQIKNERLRAGGAGGAGAAGPGAGRGGGGGGGGGSAGSAGA